MAHRGVAIAKEDVGTRALFQHVAKIFEGHDRVNIALHIP